MASRLNRAGIRRQRPRERGVAVLITLLLVLGVGIGLVTSGLTRTIPLQVRAENKAALAMAEAKQALIGRAAADDDRPGSLPCPDVNNDGNAGALPLPGDPIGDCPSYIGRLPWKTLGLADLRDEHGERLWYALSPKYRDHARAQPINSDTPGVVWADPTRNERLVYANTTATTLAPRAVAIIFSAGALVGGQQRDATVELCAATGTLIARFLCVSNYLEAAGGAAGANNASAAGPYIAAEKTPAFNDRLSVLTPEDLMPLVEVRVAAEVRTALSNYKIMSSCNCFPWAANPLGASEAGRHRGLFPMTAVLPETWGQGKIPDLPAWFRANLWGDVIYFTASEKAVNQKGPKCNLCTSPTLIVEGVGGYSSLFFMPGPAAALRQPATWPAYLDDEENNGAKIVDDVYIRPTSTALARDRLILMPSASPLQCAANSRMLFENAPCKLRKGTRKNELKPECLYAVENLQVCSCKDEAKVLIEKPCSKKIKKSECKGAVSVLKKCNL